MSISTELAVVVAPLAPEKKREMQGFGFLKNENEDLGWAEILAAQRPSALYFQLAASSVLIVKLLIYPLDLLKPNT